MHFLWGAFCQREVLVLLHVVDQHAHRLEFWLVLVDSQHLVFVALVVDNLASHLWWLGTGEFGIGSHEHFEIDLVPLQLLVEFFDCVTGCKQYFC